MGKFDLNPDELKKFDLSPSETRVSHGENMTLTPEEREKRRIKSEEKLASGAIKEEGAKLGDHFFVLAPEDVNRFYAMSPAEQEQFKKSRDEIGREFMSNVGGQVAGSMVVPVGEGIAAPIGKKIIGAAAGKTTSVVEKALPNTIEFAKKAIEHSQKEMGRLAAAKAVGQDVAQLARKTGSAGVSFAGNAAPAAGGVMSNAIDRLRVAAQSDNRARELLTRIEQQDFTVPGTVSQGTLGEP